MYLRAQSMQALLILLQTRNGAAQSSHLWFGRAMLQGLTMRLDPGMSLLITGPSGAGKSSLMRAIAGEHSIASKRQA